MGNLEIFRQGMKKSDWYLLILYAAIVACLVIRIHAEATHYISPDSAFYLKVSENILAGKGAVVPKCYPFTCEEETFFAFWSLGYPFAIMLVHLVTGLGLFWASKVVNFIALAAIFILLRKIGTDKAYLPAFIFCSYPMLEVFSYSWSEPLFLCTSLYFIVFVFEIFNQINTSNAVNSFHWLSLFVLLTALFLVRYAGLIYFILTGIISLYFLVRKNYQMFFRFILVLLCSSMVVFAYFWNNHRLTGYVTGGYRIAPEQESVTEFLTYLFRGTFNMFFVIRYNYFKAGL
ncbi:MAG: hypothetical protein H7Y04_06025, partial [Verrucomicrobia bacterium]|nr:hypothetical protein [Cytophagales bacterium]